MVVHRVGFRGRLVGRRALQRIVAETEPDLLAVHTHHALAMARGLGPPVVVHRRLDFVPSRVTVDRYRRVARVIAVSGAVARVLRRAGVCSPVDVVRDAVVPLDPSPYPPRRREEARIARVVAIGALVPHKGHLDLVRAMVDVPAELVVAGSGPELARLQRLSRRLGVAGRVRFPGRVEDVGGLLTRADVFCHPSRAEGLGQAVLEAMTAGVPVVATRAGGLPEIVADRGHLVPPRRPGALAAALRDVLRRPERARRRVLAGRDALVAAHAVSALVSRTEALYDLARRSTGGGVDTCPSWTSRTERER